MQTKLPLKISGTLLFLFGVFGYIFPTWGHTIFSNNENLWHVLSGLALVFITNFSSKARLRAFATAAVLYLALGIYGFALNNPDTIHIKKLIINFDFNEFDNYFHTLAGVLFAWLWWKNR